MQLKDNTIEFFLNEISTDRLRNYIIPGLSSSMIGAKHESGACVRLFDASRTQETEIIPHSHRFDFQCLVLRGSVVNHHWTTTDSEEDGDLYQPMLVTYTGLPGAYTPPKPVGEVQLWRKETTLYSAGDWYGMDSDDIHSIVFGKDAVVLFFEGHEVIDRTVFLQPVVDGQVVPTFKVEPWMFQKVTA
jgi:hypothetical protein